MQFLQVVAFVAPDMANHCCHLRNSSVPFIEHTPKSVAESLKSSLSTRHLGGSLGRVMSVNRVHFIFFSSTQTFLYPFSYLSSFLSVSFLLPFSFSSTCSRLFSVSPSWIFYFHVIPALRLCFKSFTMFHLKVRGKQTSYGKSMASPRPLPLESTYPVLGELLLFPDTCFLSASGHSRRRSNFLTTPASLSQDSLSRASGAKASV